MNIQQVLWPTLELTEWEKQYVSYYREGNEKAGVLRRCYPLQMRATNLPDDHEVLDQRFVPSGRRTRLFALTFSGDIDNWEITIATAAGELLTQDWASVSALLNAPFLTPTLPTRVTNLPTQTFPGGGPLIFDPNVVLERTMTLLLQGRLIVPIDPQTPTRYVLNIACHCWEMPNVPTRIVPPPTQLPTREAK